MKKLSILLCTILATKITLGQACDGQVVFLSQDGQCDYNPWVLVFEDNFDGNSIDLGKWSLPYQGVVRDFSHTKEKQWYANTGTTPSLPISNNIEVSNGTLKLIARREVNPIVGTYVSDFSTNPLTYTTESFNYSSAEINSKYKFGYGMYEISCKIPKGKGFWPAFWMFGNGPGGINNEIDVFEFWDNSTHDHNMTVHYNNQRCLTDYLGPDYSLKFHTYTVVWDNYKIEWYVDGHLKRRSTKFYTLLGQNVDCNGIQAFLSYIKDNVFPKDPMNIIANLALQTGTYQPDANTPFPSSLEIDYIRYYQKKGCPGTINATDISQLNLSNEIYNLVIGTTITLGGNFTVPSGQQLEIIARDEIIVGPGFVVENGSNFYARIDPTICQGVMKIGNISSDSTHNNSTPSNAISENSDLGINQNSNRYKIKTYPNPNNGKFTIEFENQNFEYLEVYLIDANGRIAFSSSKIRESKLEINMSSSAKGTYILNILDTRNKKAFVNKIVFNQ